MTALLEDCRHAPLTPAESTLVAFALKVTRHPQRLVREDVERLRQAGFSDAAILEATHVIGFFNHINRVVDALGLEPEPDWS